PTLLPYTSLHHPTLPSFPTRRSSDLNDAGERSLAVVGIKPEAAVADTAAPLDPGRLRHHQRRAGIGEHAEMIDVPVGGDPVVGRSEEHTSELQSRSDLVCRLLLEKKK